MTKKDYVLLAKCIKSSMVDDFRIDYIRFIQLLCAMLKADNPHFDEVKFRKAINS